MFFFTIARRMIVSSGAAVLLLVALNGCSSGTKVDIPENPTQPPAHGPRGTGTIGESS